MVKTALPWLLMALLGLPSEGTAETPSPKEPQKEPDQAPAAELKKKADPKPDPKAVEDKPSAEGTGQDPKKKGEPDRKPDSKPAPANKPASEPAADVKKKTETEGKAEGKSGQDEKPAEPPAAPPKAEDPAKKPVTSLNLTIKLALMAEPSLFPVDIEVEVDKQKATLTGTVPSEDDKSKAGQIAKAIEGLESVVNKLTVDASVQHAWTKKQDEAITQLVKDRLNRSETLKAVGFEVKSEHGIVALSGKTHYQVIALEAAEAARHVPGVRAVTTAGVQLTPKD
ncbi:MAG: BON domain-containing protein [Nitrospiraceae bacterium]|nr:BON domain-containing protein [Nitrospiraceae bacterium]